MQFASGNDTTTVTTANGAVEQSVSYALPQSLDVLQSPKFKAADGTAVLDQMIDSAKRASKAIYFDNCGVMHYINRAFDTQLFSGGTSQPPTAQWLWTDSNINRDGIQGSLSIKYAMQDTYQKF